MGDEELDQKARAALEDRLTWQEGDLEVVERPGEKRKDQELGGAMALADMILSISENIKVNRYRNETDVREAVVIRILSGLGWDVFNPDIVRREYGVERRRVDYALFTTMTSPAVFIEVKAPNATLQGDRQLFEYAFHEGAPFAILVDGREWSFFLPGEQGSYAERRVYKLDLLERRADEAARIFERYLKYDRVKDGRAIQDVRSDYQNAARDRQARDAILKEWADLVSEPDELLVDLIAEKVVSLVGFRPIDEYVEENSIISRWVGVWQRYSDSVSKC
jgi:predicted type IV restriction endonuclease